jgi:hypothetical protein
VGAAGKRFDHFPSRTPVLTPSPILGGGGKLAEESSRCGTKTTESDGTFLLQLCYL